MHFEKLKVRIKDLLVTKKHIIVAVSGLGGSGKTTLATEVKTKPIFSIRLAVSLQLLQFLVFVVLALPLVISKAVGYSLVDKIGLTTHTFYIFVLVAQAIGSFWSLAVIRNRLKINKLGWGDLGFKRFNIGKSLLYFVGFYGLMFGILILFAILTFATGINGDSESASASRVVQASLGLWPSILVTVIIAPIIEEILFRGILFKRLLEKHSLAFSIVVGGLIFAVMHLNPIQAIAVLPMGMYLCVMYRKLDSIIPGIFLHASWNLLVVFITASAL